MIVEQRTRHIGVLLSGGIDSSVLVADLVERGCRVRPLYISSDVVWQPQELACLQRFLRATAAPNLDPLTVLDLPLADLYQDHWSITGSGTPDSASPDEAVYLPARNALLLMKAAVWCQLHDIGELALATLATSPFADATGPFFASLGSALNRGSPSTISIVRPFAEMDKGQVMRLGRRRPLELTFSCISPVNELHCGACNKCAERRQAFVLDDRTDPTRYAVDLPALKA